MTPVRLTPVRLAPVRRFGSLALAVALSATLLLAGPVLAEQSVQKNCSLASGGEVNISILSGTIKLIAGTEGEVLVTGTLGDDVEELEVDCEPGHVSVDLRLPQGSMENVKADADLEITVPAGVTVSASTVSANITSTDLGGELELESVSGRIDIEGEAKAVEAASVSGNVTFKGRSASVELESVSGNVVAEEAQGRLEASSVSGSVRLLGGTLESGSLESVSGDVSTAAAVAAGGRLEVKSHSGAVKIQIPSASGASVRVSTFNGAIVNELSAEQPQGGGYGPGKTLSLEVGGGGGKIDVETFSGGVHLGSK